MFSKRKAHIGNQYVTHEDMGVKWSLQQQILLLPLFPFSKTTHDSQMALAYMGIKSY